MSTTSADITATQDELEQIAAIFALNATSQEFAAVLQRLATAALQEHLLAFSGPRAPSTLRETRELRLRLLLERLGGDLSDAQVAQLRQLTPSAARSLIAGTRARYSVHPDLETLSDLLRRLPVTKVGSSAAVRRDPDL
jgi:hypothetical protein